MSIQFLRLSMLLFLLATFFVACEKDDVVLDEERPSQENNDPANILARNQTSDCYILTFPITFLYEDGSSVTINDEEGLANLFVEAPYPVDVEYPIALVDPVSNQTVSAYSEEELILLMEGCVEEDVPGDGEYCDIIDPEGGLLLCFDIVYPVSFLLEDGTTVTAHSDAQLFNILDEDNPPSDFIYPVTLEHSEDGTQHVAHTEDEIDDLMASCFDANGGWDDNTDVTTGYILCYEFVFPLSFVLENGTTVTAQTQSDLENIFFSNNPPLDFVYPISLKHLDTGAEHSVSDAEALSVLIDNC